jgi:hypothetical protein
MGREPSCSVPSGDTQGRWLWALKRRNGTNVAAVALAKKNARVIMGLVGP